MANKLMRENGKTCKMLSVLDVGCGDEVRLLYPKVTHIDIKKGSFCLELVCDGFNLPFKDGAFGVVNCSHVLEHLINPQPFVIEIKRVCQIGVIFRIPNAKFYQCFSNSHDHVMGWSIFNFFNFLKPYFRKVEVYSSFRIPFRKQSKFKRKLRTLKTYFLSLFFGKNEIVALCLK